MIIPLRADFSFSSNIFFRLKNKIRGIFRTRHDNKQIPIVINNYNRLEYLKKLITWLETVGLRNIHIIDNFSTFPALIQFYNEIKYPVYRLNKNIGHEALWRTHVYQRFMHDFYVYTDPDVLPIEECPHDILDYYIELLDKYPQFTKIGMGMKIDDLPDHYNKKNEVVEWEKQYWNLIVEDNVYNARIDTTFALYRPGAMFQQWDRTLRTGPPYIARHLPWYEDSENPSKEEKYFMEHTTQISSWYINNKKDGA